MKYEPVFGDQSLFDGAPEDCFCVAKNVYDDYVFYREVDHCLFWQDGEKWKPLQFMSCTPIAMRRIIAEPKRWTVEDQKAGRLPEVGCNIAGKKTGINTVLFNNGDCIVTISEEHCVAIYIVDEVFAYFSPIETPEEKAERLRNEWINEAINAVRKTDVNGYESIYDALLSGALSVPTKGGE